MSVYDEIREERARAHAKHGRTSMEAAPAHDPTGRRLRILVEEVGEVAREFNDAEHDGRPVDLVALRKELIQTAAMAAAWADVCTDATTDEVPASTTELERMRYGMSQIRELAEAYRSVGDPRLRDVALTLDVIECYASGVIGA